MHRLAEDEVGVIPVLIAADLSPAVMVRTSEDQQLFTVAQARRMAELLVTCAAQAERKAAEAKTNTLVAAQPVGNA
jgi:hypothetical protein